MKIVFIVLVILCLLILMFLASTVVTFGEEEVRLRNLRKYLIPLLIMSLLIVGLNYCDQNSVLTETTRTDLPLSVYVEEAMPNEPLGFYVKELEREDGNYYSFCYYDAEDQKVMHGEVLQKSVEFIVNSNVEPNLRIIETRVVHRITKKEHVVSYYVFTVPNEGSIKINNPIQ